MTAQLLDGRAESARLARRIQKAISTLPQVPHLATVIVGRRPDSLLYIRRKQEQAAIIGIKTTLVHLPAHTSQQSLIRRIRQLNQRNDIHGILLQLPLPTHFDTETVITEIAAEKDVDGLRTDSRYDPPFLLALVHLLQLGHPKTKQLLILGHESVFRQRLATATSRLRFVTTVSGTNRGLPPTTKEVGSIITLLGRGPRIRATDIRAKTVLIDGGIRIREGKTVGDVDPSCWKTAKAISPVPGGVGPLTIAYLLANTVRAAKKQAKTAQTKAQKSRPKRQR